jgi:hypothetical protein
MLKVETAQRQIMEAKALVIKTPATRQQAADLWDALRAFRKQAEAQKEEVCRPLKTAWDEAKKPFDAFVKECQGHESVLQAKMSAWDREQDRLAREEQAKLQAKIDAENAKRLAKAEAKGRDVADVVLKVAPVVQAPPKAIETQAGTTQQRVERTVYGLKGIAKDSEVRVNDPRVTELAVMCPGLFVLDWPAFRKLAATGILDNVPCVEQTTDYVYAQRK